MEAEAREAFLREVDEENPCTEEVTGVKGVIPLRHIIQTIPSTSIHHTTAMGEGTKIVIRQKEMGTDGLDVDLQHMHQIGLMQV